MRYTNSYIAKPALCKAAQICHAASFTGQNPAQNGLIHQAVKDRIAPNWGTFSSSGAAGCELQITMERLLARYTGSLLPC
jgi:hypothetical protein